MPRLDWLASNVLKSSQNTRKVTTFRQRAVIHWQFGNFWTWPDPWFWNEFWELRIGLLERNLFITGPGSGVPKPRNVDRWSAFLSETLGFSKLCCTRQAISNKNRSTVKDKGLQRFRNLCLVQHSFEKPRISDKNALYLVENLYNLSDKTWYFRVKNMSYYQFQEPVQHQNANSILRISRTINEIHVPDTRGTYAHWKK